MFVVAFDVDGTLITTGTNYPDVPRYDVIALLHRFQELGAEVYVWSGGGRSYAQHWVDKLGLNVSGVVDKGSFKPDLAVDDEVVTLGTTNLRV